MGLPIVSVTFRLKSLVHMESARESFKDYVGFLVQHMNNSRIGVGFYGDRTNPWYQNTSDIHPITLYCNEITVKTLK